MFRLWVMSWTLLLSTTNGSGYTQQDMTDLGEHIQAVLDCADIPGAQIAVVKDGEIILEQGMIYRGENRHRWFWKACNLRYMKTV